MNNDFSDSGSNAPISSFNVIVFIVVSSVVDVKIDVDDDIGVQSVVVVVQSGVVQSVMVVVVSSQSILS